MTIGNYLYIWNDPKSKMLFAAGLEFKHLAPALGKSGGILVPVPANHGEWAYMDFRSWMHFVPLTEIDGLLAQNIYSWGDFVWVDYQPAIGNVDPTLPPPELAPEELAELVYFAHIKRPLRGNVIKTLSSRFMAYAHDDGYVLRLYYEDWRHVCDLLTRCNFVTSLGPLDLNELQRGQTAFWLRNGATREVQIVDDFDKLIDGLLKEEKQ